MMSKMREVVGLALVLTLATAGMAVMLYGLFVGHDPISLQNSRDGAAEWREVELQDFRDCMSWELGAEASQAEIEKAQEYCESL